MTAAKHKPLDRLRHARMAKREQGLRGLDADARDDAVSPDPLDGQLRRQVMSGLKAVRCTEWIAAPRATVWQLMLDDASYRDWTSAFCDESGGTRLRIVMQVTPAFEAMLVEQWPRALLRLKALCERTAGPA